MPRGFRPMALVKLAGVYADEGRFDDALRVTDECSPVVPTYPDAHFRAARPWWGSVAATTRAARSAR